MSCKLIAIGNRMMGDDGVALAAAEFIVPSLASLGIEVFFGETDVDYCMDNILKGDELIILDSACNGGAMGDVWARPLAEAIEAADAVNWQHDASLITALRIEDISVSGLLIGIEISNADFGWGLSPELQVRLPDLCNKIRDFIINYKGGIENA